MNLVDIYFKKGNPVKGYIFDITNLNLGFNKIYLAESRYQLHILRKHPESNLETIKDVLQSPDKITRGIRHSRDNYNFYKDINGHIYVAGVLQGYMDTLPKDKSYLLSAYILKDSRELKYHREIYPRDLESEYDLREDPRMYEFDFC